ncbi:unnamed protein product, partial [Musa hybrid cultivar]
KHSFSSRYFFSSECVAAERRLKLGWSALVSRVQLFRMGSKGSRLSDSFGFLICGTLCSFT